MEREKETDNQTTEERILEAAARVFTRKGYDATKTRDIQEEAGLKNVASLHYYYRSKERLFELVISRAMKDFSKIMDEILTGSLPLDQKIRSFVPNYIDFIKENPFLPSFIMTEIQRNPEHCSDMLHAEGSMEVLEKQIQDLADQKVIRPISMPNFMASLIGLVVFPFISKSVLKLKTGIDDEGFQQMLEERKELIPDMLINYLFYEPPKKV